MKYKYKIQEFERTGILDWMENVQTHILNKKTINRPFNDSLINSAERYHGVNDTEEFKTWYLKVAKKRTS